MAYIDFTPKACHELDFGAICKTYDAVHRCERDKDHYGRCRCTCGFTFEHLTLNKARSIQESGA